MTRKRAPEKTLVRKMKGRAAPSGVRQTARGSTITRLEETYQVDDPPRVFAFIEQNRLRDLLLQAKGPLNKAFGKTVVKQLHLVRDNQGFETLYCLVMVPGDAREARRALRAFDEHWWLARSDQAGGRLNFDFELV